MHESPLAAHWTLDPAVVFLNHGSFGACPRVVLEAQTRWRARLESQPVRFFLGELEPLFDQALAALGAFVGADPDDLAFVGNATTGVNAVVRSLRLAPGDELLTTDHAYGACRNALDWVAERAGARVVVAAVPFPIVSPDQVLEAVLGAVTPRTRLALIDHVTSPTGLVFPLERLVPALAERGVDTIVDGAHAPGMLPLDLRALGAAYYTGNCHKWMCAPKGVGFLYVRRDRQPGIVPTTISHGLTMPRTDRSRFQLLFRWTGTGDPTPALCVPEAIRVVGSLVAGGWPEVMARNRALALEARARLCAALGIAEPAPASMLGSLATLPLPDGPDAALHDALWTDHKIEVPIFAWPAAPRRCVRIAMHLHNSMAQVEALATALGASLFGP
jgi:isopenicillin-N epimerase